MKFQLNDHVQIIESKESGVVCGRAEYTTAEPSYYVRYMNAHGVAVEQWWTESAIEKKQDNG